MKENKIRRMLSEKAPMTSTRMWSTWPFYIEYVGFTGNFDYFEFVAEYAPFSQRDLEDMVRAAELHDMGSMIKVDYQNRAYVAQKAIASGFQSILFTDHRTAEDVANTIKTVKADSPEWSGGIGYMNRRYIGTQAMLSQTGHSDRVNDVVLAFMIEKKEAVDNIEEICSVPGVDMIQFGPADFCMSQGLNRSEHMEEARAAERHCIEVALKHGVTPRCEIVTPDQAQYYIDLGVRCFSLGDQFAKLRAFWDGEGKQIRTIADSLK